MCVCVYWCAVFGVCSGVCVCVCVCIGVLCLECESMLGLDPLLVTLPQHSVAP